MDLSLSNLLTGSPSLPSSASVRSDRSGGEEAASAFDSDQHHAGTFEDHLVNQVAKTPSLAAGANFLQATLPAVESSPSQNADAVGSAEDQSMLQSGVLGIIETFLKNNPAGNWKTAGTTALSDTSTVIPLFQGKDGIKGKTGNGPLGTFLKNNPAGNWKTAGTTALSNTSTVTPLFQGKDGIKGKTGNGPLGTHLNNNPAGNWETAGVMSSLASTAETGALSDANTITPLSQGRDGTKGKTGNGTLGTHLNNNSAGNWETAGVMSSLASTAETGALSDANTITSLSQGDDGTKGRAGNGPLETHLNNNSAGNWETARVTSSLASTAETGALSDTNFITPLSQGRDGTKGIAGKATTGVRVNSTSKGQAATFASVGRDEISSFSGQFGLTGYSLKEKKSTTTNEEGSFIQATSTETPSAVVPSSISFPDRSFQSKPSANQQLGANNLPEKNNENASINEAAPAISAAGTKNADSNIAMSQEAILSESMPTTNWPGSLASLQDVNTGSTRTVLLNSNSDFESTLRQVVLSAQSYGVDEASAPHRMAIELQTPPGAVVNVYVSQQNGQWRAQLSTDDAQALNWLQKNIDFLRQAAPETGLDLRWSPPQTEGGSSNDASEWSGGGQQQPQEQPERQTPGHSPESDDFPQNWSSDFMKAIAALGSSS